MKWVKRAIYLGEQRGFNRTAIANALGKSRGYLGAIERGSSRPLLEDVLRIAELLGVSMDYLLAEDQPWLKPADREGVGSELDRGSDAILRVVSAHRLSTDEAIRRLTLLPPTTHVVGVQRIVASNHEPNPDVADVDLESPPPGVNRRV
jgi:transcriptional regulator with XRE-family HTH domain